MPSSGRQQKNAAYSRFVLSFLPVIHHNHPLLALAHFRRYMMRPMLPPTFLALSLSLTILAFAPSVLRAQDAVSNAQAPIEAEQTAPGKFIQSLGQKAISLIADKNITIEQRDTKFRQLLNDAFDLKTIGRFVIGRTWNAATPEQQAEYMRLFQGLVVKSYGDRMTLYTGEGFEVIGERPESEKDFIVNSQITHPDGSPPTAIEWRVRQRDGKLGVIDVIVEGVSLSVTQRQEYSSVIQNNGGKIDGLLDLMRQQMNAPDGSPQPG
jgi:phospholipid transport system substrate-binding protein